MTEHQEEILEAIWKSRELKNHSIEAIRKKCAITFTQQDLKFLEEQALITSGDEINLTEEGEQKAKRIVRCHRLAETLLWSILKLRNSEMEEIACKIEHTLLPAVEESICILLGHPSVCPDGKPIPQGRCCSKQVKTVSNIVVGLDELKPGEEGTVTYIIPSDHAQLHRLMAFGLRPGIQVQVHRTKPALCIKFENTELATGT